MQRYIRPISSLLCFLASGQVLAGAFLSGSTGADGALAPTADVTIQLPPSGILNYTTVNIPAGVTVKFAKNATNTGIVMLTTGNVTIAGTIDIRGGRSLDTRFGLAADMNKGGVGGPGGFDGGRGGLPEQSRNGGTGYGPGGGGGGNKESGDCYNHTLGAGGGGFAAAGTGTRCVVEYGFDAARRTGFGGPGYGSNSMLPIVGGSGGGGGTGGINAGSVPGSGGGGGGGAIMIVSSGRIDMTGTINASGGAAGSTGLGTTGSCTTNKDFGSAGGGGAGGLVRLLAPEISAATGTINVAGGQGGCRDVNSDYNVGGPGGLGRSSVEIVTGGTFSIANSPTLRIDTVGGIPVPPNPTGAGDIALDPAQANPVAIAVKASNIPVGAVVKLTLNQPYGPSISVNTTALAGTLALSTATANIEIPSGPSVITASTSYSLTLAMGEALKTYAGGERVEKVEIAAVLGGEMKATLITVSGKQYEVPAAVLAMVAA